MTDSTGLSLYFDVPGTPQWQRPEEARLAQDPCGGPPTLLTTNTSVQPRRFRVEVDIHWGPHCNTRRAALEAAWAAKGPYTLTAPTISPDPFLVILDPSQGPLEWKPQAERYTATVAFQEYSTTVGGVPQAGFALLTWTILAHIPDESYTVQITWDYAGSDMTAFDSIMVYQAGTTSAAMAAAPFDPGGAWFPLTDTGGAATGTRTVNVPASRLDAFPSWRVSYYHYARGLVPQALTITVDAPATPAVQIFWGWLTPTGLDPTYAAAVTWNYNRTDMTLTDQIYLFQAGTTTGAILANATDPVSGRWFPVVGTGGRQTATASVEITATLLDAHPNWHVGYLHTVHGLLDAGLLVDLAHGIPAPPAPRVVLTFAWEPPAFAVGSANYCTARLTWAYAWADQHPDDFLVIHDGTIDGPTIAAALPVTNDDPAYHWFLAWTAGRSGPSGAAVLSLADVVVSAHTPRHLSYYSILHGLLGTIDLPDFPL